MAEIKKPIDLGFVDFSTLEKRKHFCEEELRLNKLLSPDLYIGVVPVVRRGSEFTLNSKEPGEIVEYAVKMRQFGEGDLFLDHFERGVLTEEDVVNVAVKLAKAHADAPRNDDIAAYGSVEANASMLLTLVDTLERFVGTTLFAEQLDCAKGFCFGFLHDHRDLFSERVREGFIRQCHGDLHLRNICFLEGRIEFFDRIEFNPAFMNIDTMYDAAFLYMDLQYRDAHAMANRFINTYLEESGDYRAALLLPFYACCRALIRAEVLSIQAAERETNETDCECAVHSARRYVRLACGYAKDPPGGVVLMCGLSGSGKSTVAMELAKRLNAIHIRSDAVRKHLAGVSLHDHHTNIYTPEMTKETYRTMVRVALDLAESGARVILDARFDNATRRSEAIEACRERGLDARIVQCRAGLTSIKQRLANRSEDISDADASLLAQQLQAFDPLEAEEETRALVLDTDKPLDYDDIANKLFSVAAVNH